MIKNVANPVEEIVNVNRAQIEHRATWMGLIYDEMVKAGIDAEPIIRRAIKRTGLMHGERFRKQCADPKNCVDFKNAFLGDESSLGPQTFHMDNIKADGGNVTVDFHYCALVSAWQKLGFDDETVALLCDMAMDGDRGIAQAMGLELSLDDTIAKGCASCKLHFHQ
ncbi:MAG: L-2-amino-thiazoline-4-carboxylic acid hydrolase [Bacillota bacterium]